MAKQEKSKLWRYMPESLPNVPSDEVPWDIVDDGRFQIGSDWGKYAYSSYVCIFCKGSQFYVGADDFAFAIKCVTCGWEACVHE